MNLRKSILIALAHKDENATWLAEQLNMSKQQISQIMGGSNVRSDTIDKVAGALGMPSSELIALGENRDVESDIARAEDSGL